MSKFTIEQLDTYRDTLQREYQLTRARITVHMGTCGLASGAGEVMQTLMSEIAALNLNDVVVTSSGCAGLCSREPMVTVEIAGAPPVKYVDVDRKRIIKILAEHVVGGTIVDECVLAAGCERLG